MFQARDVEESQVEASHELCDCVKDRTKDLGEGRSCPVHVAYNVSHFQLRRAGTEGDHCGS